ncbi:MAG: GyrI-like domain-containing protein [Bacillota bacterium]|nr:GyrI-like domain-containing protein [Bacillota bacterium]
MRQQDFVRITSSEFGNSELEKAGTQLTKKVKCVPALYVISKYLYIVTLKGDKDMDYKIVQKDAFKVMGKIFKVPCADGEHNLRISKLWEQCNTDGTIEKLLALDRAQTLLGVCLDFEEDQLSYMIAIEDVRNSQGHEFEMREIPAASWAVFTSVGPMPDAIIKVWSNIFQEWFPTKGFEHANGPEIEVYPSGDTSAQDYRCEVWIPVVEKL